MKLFAITLFITLVSISNLYSQRRIAAMDAYLEVKGLTLEGTDVTVKSNELQILYEEGLATGQLLVRTLVSTDKAITQWISSNPESVVRFKITIPPGKFAFGNSMNEKFTAEALFELEGGTTTFTIDLDVSNLRNNNDNAFQIIGRGRVSLSAHLGMTDLNNLQDDISFQFMQNVTIFTP